MSLLTLAGCASGPAQEASPEPLSVNQPSTESSSETLPEGSSVTLYRNAITELNNNNLEVAKNNFLMIIKEQPDLAGPWANLALIHIKQERFEDAEMNIQAALDKNPEMAQALNMAGFIENRKGNINKAKYYYEKAIEKKSDYALAHYNLALLYDVYLQNIAKAVQHYQKYLSFLGNEDKKTKTWLEELKRNLKGNNA